MNIMDYRNKLPVPQKPVRPPMPSREATADKFREYANDLEVWENLMTGYKAAWDEYKDEDNRLRAKFRADALEEYGFTNHPKANLAWGFAWEEGHGNGLQSVLDYLGKAADLVL